MIRSVGGGEGAGAGSYQIVIDAAGLDHEFGRGSCYILGGRGLLL